MPATPSKQVAPRMPDGSYHLNAVILGNAEVKMTMPHERTRAVVQTRDFLVELSGDTSMPERVRRDARFLLRHFPTEYDVQLAGQIEEQAETLPVGVLGPVFASGTTFKAL